MDETVALYKSPVGLILIKCTDEFITALLFVKENVSLLFLNRTR